MHMRLLGFAAALAIAGGAGATEPPRSSTASIASQLQPAADHFASAWNLHDPKVLASSFTEDAVLINPMGRQARGRAQIEALFADEHQHELKGTTLTSRVVDVRLLSPSLAFVDEDLVITGRREPTGRVLPDLQVHGAMLMQKENGTWLVAEARPYVFTERPKVQQGVGGAGNAGEPMKRPRRLQK